MIPLNNVFWPNSIKEGQWADQKELKKDEIAALSSPEFPSLTGTTPVKTRPPENATSSVLPLGRITLQSSYISKINPLDFEEEKKLMAKELERKMEERQRKEVFLIFIKTSFFLIFSFLKH